MIQTIDQAIDSAVLELKNVGNTQKENQEILDLIDKLIEARRKAIDIGFNH